MSEEFTFSDPGEGLEEAEVLEIHVSEGDHVADGDTILTVETDKASTEVASPFAGTVDKVQIKTGDVVRVGDHLLSYTPDDASGKETAEDEAPAGDEAHDSEKTESETSERSDEAHAETTASSDEATGKEREAQTSEERSSRDNSREDQAGERKTSRQQPVPAAPSTRRLARERGIDLHEVTPSGPQGRVTAEDVEAAAQGEQQDREQTGQRPSEESASTLPDFSRWGETERTPLRSIRRATAERMRQSWTQIPHVYHQDVADVTELERFRHEYETQAQANGGRFTLSVVMLKALVYALKQYPRFNASLDEDNGEIVLKHYFHIGLAVATERGLLVPVVRDVDRKNLVELTEEISTLVERTRNGDVGREEMEGACITLTNPGPLGGTALTPLVNPPEVAILGLGQARLEPVVRGDLDDYEMVPRLRLPLSLGFDHRVNDGADAANFVTTLIRALEDPQSLLLKL